MDDDATPTASDRPVADWIAGRDAAAEYIVKFGETRAHGQQLAKAIRSIKPPVMSDRPVVRAEIDELVNRFLAWPLPKSVCSDLCATNSSYAYPRSGTNLLNVDEARAMLEYVLADRAAPPSGDDRG